MFGVRSDATDDFDYGVDFLDEYPDAGYAAFYHAYDPPAWTGEEGFYRTDFRALMSEGDVKTWGGLHLWADPVYYGQETMMLSIAADQSHLPPTGWNYKVELLYVPEGIEGAPAIGTTWELELDKTLTIEVPTYGTYNGLESYEFAFTIEAVPEPGAAVLLLAGLGMAARRSVRWRTGR